MTSQLFANYDVSGNQIFTPNGGGTSSTTTTGSGDSSRADIKGIFNLKRSNTVKTRGVIAAAAGPARIMRVGDSTTAGSGGGTNASGGTTGSTGAYPNNPMSQLNAKLIAAAVKSGNGGFTGNGSVDVGYPAYDPRVALAGGFGVSAVLSLGGALFSATAAGATIAFNPGKPFNCARVYFATNAGNGTFSTSIDGGSALVAKASSPVSGGQSVIPTSAASTITYVDYDIPLGNHTITTTAVNGGQVFIAGIQTWDTSDTYNLLTMGHWGKVVADIATITDAWCPYNSIIKHAPDMTLISLTINDATQATAKATYQSGMDFLIQEALKYGDVMLSLGAVSNNAASTNGTLYGIQSAVKELAESYDLPYFSFPAVAGNFTVANAKGWMFDSVHPTAAGYAQEATAMAAALKWMVTNAK